MKKTYTTPALSSSGSAVRATLSGTNNLSKESVSSIYRPKPAPSAVGFYL